MKKIFLAIVWLMILLLCVGCVASPPPSSPEDEGSLSTDSLNNTPDDKNENASSNDQATNNENNENSQENQTPPTEEEEVGTETENNGANQQGGNNNNNNNNTNTNNNNHNNNENNNQQPTTDDNDPNEDTDEGENGDDTNGDNTTDNNTEDNNQENPEPPADDNNQENPEPPTDDNTENGENNTPPEGDGNTPPEEASYLNGIELSNFSIIYSNKQNDYGKRAAEYIQAEILERTDLLLPIRKDTYLGANGAYEIIVGETSRSISKRMNAETEGTQFAILAEETQIALEADYFVIAAAAYFFIETYVPEDNYSATIPKEVTIHDPIVKEAKNYIILIGDGMGPNQTLLFEDLSNTAEYSDKEDIFYGYYLPAQGYAKTKSLSRVTDSAAAGTALATGHKTINGYVGQDANRNEVQSLTELAASRGMSTAVMSTEASTGATPASFSAHANSRSDSADILADQTALKNRYGTIICCKYDYYTKDGIATIEEHITTTLDTLDNNENGFFLMYEEAYIDKHCHSNKLNETFLAVLRFNQAIARFMEYAFYHPDTFVLITADHETGDLYDDANGFPTFHYTDHTNANVPVFAYGDGSEFFDGKTIENVQLPMTIASFMGVDDFGDTEHYKSLTKPWWDNTID